MSDWIQEQVIPSGNWLFQQRINYNDGFERILFRNGSFHSEIKNAAQTARALKGDMLYTVTMKPISFTISGNPKTCDQRGYQIGYTGVVTVQVDNTIHAVIAYVQKLDNVESLRKSIQSRIITEIRLQPHSDITEEMFKKIIFRTSVDYLLSGRNEKIVNFGFKIIGVPEIIWTPDERFQKDRIATILIEDITRAAVVVEVRQDVLHKGAIADAGRKKEMDRIVIEANAEMEMLQLQYNGRFELRAKFQQAYIDNREKLFTVLLEKGFTLEEIAKEHPEISEMIGELPGIGTMRQLPGAQSQHYLPPSAASPQAPAPAPNIFQQPPARAIQPSTPATPHVPTTTPTPLPTTQPAARPVFQPEVTATPEWTRQTPIAGISYDPQTDILTATPLKLTLKRGMLSEARKMRCSSYPVNDRCYVIQAHPTLPVGSSIYRFNEHHITEPYYLIDEITRAIREKATITLEVVDDKGWSTQKIDTSQVTSR